VIAVDTNVLVRLIVADDPDQVQTALALAEREILFVPLTVLAELEWVLRSRYEYDRSAIAAALANLPLLISLRFEDHDGVDWAIGRYARGGELADYLHLVAARGIGRLATFEKRLAARAASEAPVEVITLT
jgi:predicted nucleic-acid-binding protein